MKRAPSLKTCRADGCTTQFLGTNGHKYCEACKPAQDRKKIERRNVKRKEMYNEPDSEFKKIIDARNKAQYAKNAVLPSFQKSERARKIKYMEKDWSAEPGTYDRLHAEQGGLCAICRRLSFKNGKQIALAFDHCHTKMRARGLLCWDCNTGIGKFQDDPIRLVRSAAYVTEDPEKKQVLEDVLRFLVLGISTPSPEVIVLPT